jgi:hypothetical protein
MDVGVVWEGVEWINLFQDGEQRRFLVNKVMKLLIE